MRRVGRLSGRCNAPARRSRATHLHGAACGRAGEAARACRFCDVRRQLCSRVLIVATVVVSLDFLLAFLLLLAVMVVLPVLVAVVHGAGAAVGLGRASPRGRGRVLLASLLGRGARIWRPGGPLLGSAARGRLGGLAAAAGAARGRRRGRGVRLGSGVSSAGARLLAATRRAGGGGAPGGPLAACAGFHHQQQRAIAALQVSMLGRAALRPAQRGRSRVSTAKKQRIWPRSGVTAAPEAARARQGRRERARDSSPDR